MAESRMRRRIDFAQRVARVLRGIEGADLLGPDPDVSGVTLQVPHADFLIAVLDLRLRVYLDAEGMSAAYQLRVASKLLRHWSDSAAAMVVAEVPHPKRKTAMEGKL